MRLSYTAVVGVMLPCDVSTYSSTGKGTIPQGMQSLSRLSPSASNFEIIAKKPGAFEPGSETRATSNLMESDNCSGGSGTTHNLVRDLLGSRVVQCLVGVGTPPFCLLLGLSCRAPFIVRRALPRL